MQLFEQLKFHLSKYLPAGEISFDLPPSAELGDFATPCFRYAKELGKSPMEIASEMAESVVDGDLIEQAVAAGPYLNITLNRKFFSESVLSELAGVREKPVLFPKDQPERIMVEYSSPNTNKPLTLGHLRNNFIGMTVANLLEERGDEVVRAQIINDRGIHICKSMLAYQKWGQGETPESTGEKGDHFVGRYYVLYSQKEKAGEIGETEAAEMLRKWEDGDAEVRALWEQMNSWVLPAWDETYTAIGSVFDREYLESELYLKGKDIVSEGLDKGIFYKREDGAVEIDLTDDKLDKKVLLRSDGTSVYMTQDLATTKMKFDEEDLDQSIWVVGDEQIYHFKVLFLICQKLGFDWATKCYHLSYGMVNLPDGKMKSREGTVVDADDMLAELGDLARAEIEKRYSDLSEEEIAKRSRQVSLGALKFFIHRVSPQKSMVYDPKASIAFEGDTGPYVQYVHARICSIARSAEEQGLQVNSVLPTDYQMNSEEVELLKHLSQFQKTIQQTTADYQISRICEYVLTLAHLFNKFYLVSPVLKADSPELASFRLGLATITRDVLARSLCILGIPAPDRM